jgi:hypothetical protein
LGKTKGFIEPKTLRLNAHQCSYVKTKGVIKTKSLPGQTEGLRGWLRRNGWLGGWCVRYGWIGGRKDGYKGGVWV